MIDSVCINNNCTGKLIMFKINTRILRSGAKRRLKWAITPSNWKWLFCALKILTNYSTTHKLNGLSSYCSV